MVDKNIRLTLELQRTRWVGLGTSFSCPIATIFMHEKKEDVRTQPPRVDGTSGPRENPGRQGWGVAAGGAQKFSRKVFAEGFLEGRLTSRKVYAEGF